VTCLEPHHPAGILSLALPANGLAGTLPQTLAGLALLTTFFCTQSTHSTDDSQYGPYVTALTDTRECQPYTLARLHHLRHLDLSRNALRGTVSSAMGSMRRLRVGLFTPGGVQICSMDHAGCHQLNVFLRIIITLLKVPQPLTPNP
jgi:hypothetical protein